MLIVHVYLSLSVCTGSSGRALGGESSRIAPEALGELRELWESSGSSLGELWELSERALGELWESSGSSGRALEELWESSGRALGELRELWELRDLRALGEFWELRELWESSGRALGELWDSSEPAPQPEGSLAKPSVSSPFPEVDSTVHTGPHNYYAVARSPKAPGLVGVWFVPWTYLEMLLPGQKLCGSSCKLKRFSSLDSAKAFFKTSNSSVEPKLFP